MCVCVSVYTCACMRVLCARERACVRRWDFLVHILTASAHVRRHHVSMTHIESKLKTYTMSGPSLHIDFEGAKGGGMCANQRRMGAGGDFFFYCCYLLFVVVLLECVR